MKLKKRSEGLVIAACLIGMPCIAQEPVTSVVSNAAKPWAYDGQIHAFEEADRKQPPPQGAIVCIGSSSMRGWKSIVEDLAPLTVIPRGFGGSTMKDAVHYADRIVIAYKPRAVVLYEGDNDLGRGLTTPEELKDTFLAFVKKVHGSLPEARIYVLSVKPSISRWAHWPKMKEANRLIAEECAKNKLLTYVDVASGMLDDTGNPRPELFQNDKLHMTRAGYVLWRDVLKPVLMKAELAFEPKENSRQKAQEAQKGEVAE